MRLSKSLPLLFSLLIAGGCGDASSDEFSFDAKAADGKSDALMDKTLTVRPNGERNYTDTWREPGDNVMEVILAAADKIVLSGTVWHFNALKPSGDTSCTDNSDCMGRSICWEQAFCRDIQYDDQSIISLSVEFRQERPTVFGFFLSASYDPASEGMVVECPSGNVFYSVAVDFFAEEITINNETTYTFLDCGLEIPRSQDVFDNLVFSAVAIPLPADDDDYFGEFGYDFIADSK